MLLSCPCSDESVCGVGRRYATDKNLSVSADALPPPLPRGGFGSPRKVNGFARGSPTRGAVERSETERLYEGKPDREPPAGLPSQSPSVTLPGLRLPASASQRLFPAGLALSVIASQCHLSQRERLWQAGPLPTGRLRPDRAQKGGPCYRGQRLLDKRTLSSCCWPRQRSTTVPETSCFARPDES